MQHIPVLLNEVLRELNLKSNDNFIDCTIGEAGHSKEILKKIAPNGLLLGIDRNKEQIKRAFFIIFVAYATGIASMIPLFWAGAGLFTGFAITTIIGISIGVFITRPAYSVIIEILLSD